MPRWEWLPNIEQPKKYKTHQQIFPVERRVPVEISPNGRWSKLRSIGGSSPPHWHSATQQQRQMLAGDFVDDHALGIFHASRTSQRAFPQPRVPTSAIRIANAKICETRIRSPRFAWKPIPFVALMQSNVNRDRVKQTTSERPQLASLPASQAFPGLWGNNRDRRRSRGKSRSEVYLQATAMRSRRRLRVSVQFLCSSFGVQEWARASVAEPSSSKSESSKAGSLIVYFSVAQLPRSCNWQRSLQNGNSASVAESVGFLQMGQRCFMVWAKTNTKSFCYGKQQVETKSYARIGNGEGTNAGREVAALGISNSVTRPIKS